MVNMLKSAYPSERVCPAVFLNEFTNGDSWDATDQYHLYCGHMGYSHAIRVSGTVVTVLRNPIDRILSLYYYWRSVDSETEGPLLAKRHGIEEFLNIQARAIVEDVWNTQSWQIAADHSLETRQRMRHLGEDDLFALAKKNIQSMAYAGVSEYFSQSAADIMRIVGKPGVKTVRTNVTPNRVPADEISISLRRKISSRCEVDCALYDYVLKGFLSNI